MRLTRLVLLAAAAAGVSYWLTGRGAGAAPRLRPSLGAGVRAPAGASSPVAETMWTPADPAEAAVATNGSPPSPA